MSLPILLVSPAGATQYIGQSGTIYNADAFGRFTVTPGDIKAALDAGMVYAPTDTRFWNAGVVATASSSATVSSGTSLANGTLTIAAQPDVPRKLAAVVVPGAAITAGTLTLVYTGHDGATTTDVLSLVMGNVTTTLTSTKGVAHLTSATVAALAGGSSPTIKIGTTTDLGLPCPVGSTNFTAIKETVDGADAAVGTVNALNNGLYTPTTTPNATKSLSFGYTFTSLIN